jgi:hypothetical protein
MRTWLIGVSTGALMLPLLANAQQPGSGPATGAAVGAVGGAVVGGPVGAVVGGVAGAVMGGLSEDHRPRFRQYVVQQGRSSYRHAGELRVGTVLPSTGVTYYEVPSEYGVRDLPVCGRVCRPLIHRG